MELLQNKPLQFNETTIVFISVKLITGFLPNQGNQGNIREFYFDLKYQGKIREKRKKIGNQGNFSHFAHYFAKNINDCF